MRESTHMHANWKTVALLLLIGLSPGSMIAPRALADEIRLKQNGQTSSSKARASVAATIVERPSFTCDRVMRAVTVRIEPLPPLTDHWDPAVRPQVECSYVGGLLNLTVELGPRPKGPPRASGQDITNLVNMNAMVGSEDAGAAHHRHIFEIIYNFE